MKNKILLIIVVCLVLGFLCLLNEYNNLKVSLNYCCMGTWINSQTGLGYSGDKINFNDIPANPFTGEACY